MQLPKFHPQPAVTAEDTGLPRGVLFELVLKRCFLEGTITLHRLISETKLDYGVALAMYRNLQKEQLCDTKGMIGDDYEFTLTQKGLRMAEEAYRKNQYVGPAPVPLNSYCQAVREQAFRPQITQDSLARHMSDIVVPEDVVRDLGAAIMTGGTIFLYGPTGNGKSSIAERMHRIFHDYVYIPYAAEVSSQILNVYDPIVHRAAEEQPQDIDLRWVLCQRPFLLVGGEMQADMLEPRVDEVTRICLAPLQMRANNGILVIDDFGRQQMKPRELLNRWIVPLDRKIDFLSLWSGVKFEIPFELMIIFATNLEPSHLAEEAFMRRVKNKIKIDATSPANFVHIMRMVCEGRSIAYNDQTAEYACKRSAELNATGLRACFPRDLVDVLVGVASFEQREPQLTQEQMDRALKLYFTR